MPFALLTPGAAAQASPKAAPSQPAPQDENARRARALVDKMIQTLGGQAYLGIQDISQEGRTYGFSRGETAGGTVFWRFQKWPDRDRLELTKQRDWIIIHNGAKGWEITFRGTAIEDKKDLDTYLDRQNRSLDHVLRLWLNQPGVQLFDEGTAIAERKSAQKITILNAKNESVTLYIDTQRFLPIKRTFQKRNPADRQMDTEDEIYDNWHMVQGVMTPYDVTRTRNGEMQNQRFINKVTYNTGLADSLFEPAGPVRQK